MKFGVRKLESWGYQTEKNHESCSSFWHNTGVWRTDRGTDTLRSLLPALSYRRAGKN